MKAFVKTSTGYSLLQSFLPHAISTTQKIISNKQYRLAEELKKRPSTKVRWTPLSRQRRLGLKGLIDKVNLRSPEKYINTERQIDLSEASCPKKAKAARPQPEGIDLVTRYSWYIHVKRAGANDGFCFIVLSIPLFPRFSNGGYPAFRNSSCEAQAATKMYDTTLRQAQGIALRQAQGTAGSGQSKPPSTISTSSTPSTFPSQLPQPSQLLQALDYRD